MLSAVATDSIEQDMIECLPLIVQPARYLAETLAGGENGMC